MSHKDPAAWGLLVLAVAVLLWLNVIPLGTLGSQPLSLSPSTPVGTSLPTTVNMPTSPGCWIQTNPPNGAWTSVACATAPTIPLQSSATTTWIVTSPCGYATTETGVNSPNPPIWNCPAITVGGSGIVQAGLNVREGLALFLMILGVALIILRPRS